MKKLIYQNHSIYTLHNRHPISPMQANRYQRILFSVLFRILYIPGFWCSFLKSWWKCTQQMSTVYNSFCLLVDRSHSDHIRIERKLQPPTTSTLLKGIYSPVKDPNGSFNFLIVYYVFSLATMRAATSSGLIPISELTTPAAGGLPSELEKHFLTNDSKRQKNTMKIIATDITATKVARC